MTRGELLRIAHEAQGLHREPFYAHQREPVLARALVVALDCIERARVCKGKPAQAIEKFDREIEAMGGMR